MEKIAAKFGLSADATEEQILAKIQDNEAQATRETVDQLIVVARALGTVTDEEKNEEKARRVAKADMELFTEMYLTVKDAAEGEQGKPAGNGKGQMIKDLIKTDGGGTQTPAEDPKKFEDLSNDELDELRENDRPKYVALFKGRYGYEPTIEE